MSLPTFLTALPHGRNYTLLGREISLDLYLLNGFRCLSVNPVAPDLDRLAGQQAFRSRFRLQPELAMQGAVPLGYEEPALWRDALAAVESLNDPIDRFVDGLFWPAVAPARTLLGLPLAPEWVGATAKNAGVEMHLRAVAAHNSALAAELAYLAGGARPDNTIWRAALSAWRDCLSDSRFWVVQRNRVRRIDDPGLRESDIEVVLADMPGAILNVHRAMALAYLRSGEMEDARRHFALLREEATGALAYHDIQRLLDEVVGAFAERPLAAVRPALSELARTTPPIGYRDVKRRLEPVWTALASGEAQVASVRNGARASGKQEVGGPFDIVAGLVLDVCNKVVSYKDDDRLRALQWSLVTATRLLDYPISAAQRGAARASALADMGLLYKDFYAENEQGQLPALRGDDCWFCPGQPADPDEAVLLPVHKVTKEDAVRISFMSDVVLVPRSAYAAASHAGRKAEPAYRGLGSDSVHAEIKETEQRLAADEAALTTARDKENKEVEAVEVAELAAFDKEHEERLRLLEAAEKKAGAALDAAAKTHSESTRPLEAAFGQLPTSVFGGLSANVSTLAAKSFDEAAPLLATELDKMSERARVAVGQSVGLAPANAVGRTVVATVLVAAACASLGFVPSIADFLQQHVPQAEAFARGLAAQGDGQRVLAAPMLLGIAGLVPVPLLRQLRRHDPRRPLRQFLDAFLPTECDRLTGAVLAVRRRAQEVAAREAAKLHSEQTAALKGRLDAILAEQRTLALRPAQVALEEAGRATARITGTRRDLRQRAQVKRDGIRTAYEQRVADTRAKAAARIEALRRKLTPPTVRPLDDRRHFPAYVTAKRNGYRDGAKPSSVR